MDQSTRKSMLRIALLVFCAYAFVGARLFHVHGAPTPEQERRIEASLTRLPGAYARTQFERGRRGRIFDVDGRPLALGYDTWQLVIDPAEEHDPRGSIPALTLEDRLLRLCDLLTDLGVRFDRSEFFAKGLDQHRVVSAKDGTETWTRLRRRVLARGILPHERRYITEVLERDRIAGVFFEPESVRRYPEGRLTAEIIGFVGQAAEDAKADRDAVRQGHVQAGKGGLELSLDEALREHNGRWSCAKDALGREFDTGGEWDEEPCDGDDVGLTIDLDVQRIVDRAVHELVARPDFTCNSCVAVVLETATNRILAMKSLPDASAEDLRSKRVKLENLRCRAVTDAFEPGSTIKPFILSQALESRVVGWDTTVDASVSPHVFRWGKVVRNLHDSHRNGVLTSREVIIHSSNIGMAVIGFDLMGVDGLSAALDHWEFRVRNGVGLPGEAAPIVPSREKLRKSFIWGGVSIPFGHEIALTPLTIAARFSTFGNKGLYNDPVLVDWVGKGDLRRSGRPNTRRMVNERVNEEMLEVLKRVVTEGTGKSLNDLPWTVAAKTGTTQVIKSSGHDGSYHSSMVAMAPASSPRITVFVGCYGVRGSTYYGGSAAGPAIKTIISEALSEMNVPHDKFEEDR